MAVHYAYNYAEIQNNDGWCVGVVSSSDPNGDGYQTSQGTTYVSIPVYDENYVMKYYINGAWYEDAAGTIPWQSSLL